MTSATSTRKALGRRRWIRLAAATAAVLALAVGALLIGRLVLFKGPYRQPAPLPDTIIIDLHVHAAGIGAGQSGCFISPEMRANFRFRAYLDAFGLTEAELQRHGDALVLRRLSEGIARSEHVAAAVVLALDGVVDGRGRLDTNRTEIFIPNEFVEGAARQYTNLLFGASINPYRRDALERLDWAADHGAVLVKWIPSIMDIDPADPRLIPFYQRLRHHRLPLLSHTGPERSFTSASDELAHPGRLRLPLDHGVTVIAAHAAAGGGSRGETDTALLAGMMREFPSLYADISALTQINRIGYLQELLNSHDFHGRLVYGSDFPLINTPLVSPWFYPLNLNHDQARQIAAIANPWDRDLHLKQALGVPPEVFTRSHSLIAHRRRRAPALTHIPAAPSAFSSGDRNSPGTQPAARTSIAATATASPSHPPPGHSPTSPKGSSTNAAFNNRR
jgi:predicted TIM-barrel fold metal-dependent hydrolase